MHNPVTLRFGFPDDTAAVARLAALSLSDGAVVADPLEPTAMLVELLRARALQLVAPVGASGSYRAWVGRLGRLRPSLRPGD